MSSSSSSSSSNKTIHDTDIQKIQNDIYNMIQLLDQNVLKSETVLKKRFSYLFTTSPSLFNFILKNHDKQDRNKLITNIDMMLSLVLKSTKF